MFECQMNHTMRTNKRGNIRDKGIIGKNIFHKMANVGIELKTSQSRDGLGLTQTPCYPKDWSNRKLATNTLSKYSYIKPRF